VSPAKKAATGGEPAEPKQGRPADEATPRDAAGTPTENSGPEAGARRRRGSRGGRGRRKSPPQAMEAQGRAAQAAETQVGAAQVAEAPGDAAKDAPPRAARGGGQARGRGVKSPAAPAESAFALPTAPLVPIAASDAAAPPAPARGPAAPSATDVAAEPPAPSGGASKSRPRRRGSRRRGAGEGAAAEREAVATGSAQGSGEAAGGPPPAAGPAQAYRSVPPPPRETPESASPAASVRASGESAAAAADTAEGEGSSARRRHRGSRGGRRRHKAADAAHDEVVREAEEAVGETVEPQEAEAAPEAAGSEEAGAAADGALAAKRRKRGTRRRGAAVRADGGADEAAPADEVAPTSAQTRTAPAKESARGTRTRTRDRRRPKAIVRQDEGSGLDTTVAATPVKRSEVTVEQPKRKLILVSDDGQELRVALVEDGRLAEIYIERPDKKSYLGDIYQGKVENVLGGIDAAFVDFGLEKNGFLYVDEVTAPEGEKRARRIGDALKNGQQVLVQVTKDPMGSKGARLSTKISLAGRYLVYVPGGSGVGVSRRLGQSERDRLRDISKELKPKDAGLIVRTIAEGHGLEDLKRDLRYLARLWSRLKKKSETVKAPGLVHKEVDISIEVARDLFNDTCESLIVDDVKRHKAIVSFLDKEAPELLPKVHQHTGAEPLFEAYGIEDQIAKALERRVPLPSGGNLVIDHAEALTVIDVNTGRFTRGKGLEDTITKTNLEAAHEVVRQLRLRDIGGIIIIDFIDMAHAANREMVLATLEAQLETDRTKTYVVELSPLGLVEMTRQNTTDGARGILTRSCPVCAGKARVFSDETMALNVERRVRALARKSQAKAWLIEINGGVAERLIGQRLKKLEKQTGRRIFFEGAAALPVDTFRVIAEGTAAHVQEQRVPVKEGQEVELELEFSLTYSPRDAVGYIDGYMVIVEGGRQFLGQRRKVRVTGTARTGAQATALKQGAN
jgi:ribonuclease G